MNRVMDCSTRAQKEVPSDGLRPRDELIFLRHPFEGLVCSGAGAFLGQRAVVHEIFVCEGEGRPTIIELFVEGVHVAEETQGATEIRLCEAA